MNLQIGTLEFEDYKAIGTSFVISAALRLAMHGSLASCVVNGLVHGTASLVHRLTAPIIAQKVSPNLEWWKEFLRRVSIYVISGVVVGLLTPYTMNLYAYSVLTFAYLAVQGNEKINLTKRAVYFGL